jgi:uncharacterized protein YndB with AHSA1/START domain
MDPLSDPARHALESDRRFRFPLRRRAVWGALTGVHDYPRWWPWLRDFQGTTLAPGAVWTCAVQPPLPYTVRVAIRIDDVDPGRLISAHVDGDITGTARVELHDRLAGCEVHLVSSLAPKSLFMRGLTTVARPLASNGHDWIIDTAARQFAHRVARSSSSPR